jgi:hypothetical protein
MFSATRMRTSTAVPMINFNSFNQNTPLNNLIPIERNNIVFNINNSIPVIPSSPSTLDTSSVVSSVVPVKKMKWGEPTWFLLHTLAEKVKEEHFDTVKDGLFDVIKQICTNLPCPDCSMHATQYLSSVNFNAILSKNDLRIMLFNFHNSVNLRKNLPIFSYDDLLAKYSFANTYNIFRNFIFFFQDTHYSIRMIAEDFHRKRVLSLLNNWFSQYSFAFLP